MTDARDLVVDVEWLVKHKDDPGVRLIDARTADLYDQGHIPGAISLDVYVLHWWDSTPEGLIGFRKQHEDAYGAIGVSPSDTVVFYDERSGMLAARGVWSLEVLGQARVAMLDGGLNAWTAAGLELSTEPTTLPPVTYQSGWEPDTLAGVLDTLAALPDENVNILDTRTEGEYRGETVRSKHGGAIPGAVHCDWENNLGPDGRFKSAEELSKMYAGVGLAKDKPVIAYCHGGYRAANAYIALRLAGYSTVRNYFGSWGEWGNRDDLPKEIPTKP